MIPAACTIRREMPAAVNKFNWIKTANMRKITTSALLFLLLFKLHAQPINNIRVTLPRQLPANTAEWASLPQPIIISAQAKPVQGRIPPEVMESRVVVTIENSAGKICGAHNQSNAPMSSFTSPVKTWTGAQAVGLLGQECTLRGGEYQFCVEFYGTNMATGAIVAISEKKCFPFTITGNEEYSPPTLINPENGKQYTEAGLMRPVTFRWTPLVPKPQEPVTYRLRVWQLMQGQNGVSAMRSSEPIITKDVSNVTQAVVNAVLTGPCKPPYLCEFIWNVQAISRDGKPVGNNNGTSEPYQFKATTANTEINPPALTAPANNSSLSLNDAMKSTRFQWRGVDPKPQEPVTYRLRVWQLMQGQNGTSAMRSNQPIVTKEVFNATEVTVNGILTGPCKPPYLCDFVWNVQAVARNGQPVGSNQGTSETWAFSVNQYIIQLDSIKVKCTSTPGVYSFTYKITNPNTGTAQLNALVITSSVPAGASITTFAPVLNTNIPPGGQLAITGTINAAINLSNICIGAEIKDAVNTFWKASKDTCIAVEPCICRECDKVKIEFPKQPVITESNNILTLAGSISSSPKKVKRITAGIVYFDMKAAEECWLCNKDSRQFGNFTGGTIQGNDFTPAQPGGHSVQFTNIGNADISGGRDFSLNIAIPQTVSCCEAEINFCIRYVIMFEDCTVCNVLQCYTYKKQGCKK